jgi:hypothetical protein
MLGKHNIKSASLPPRKIYNYFPPVKDALGLRTLGVYSISYECGQVRLEKAVDLFKLESKKTLDTYG